MNKQRLHYPVGLLARVLRVSRSGFYAWRQRPMSARRRADTAAKPLIREAHRLSRETYGPRRLQTELAARGLLLGRDRIARLRKEMGLRCKQRRKFKATTNSAHSLPVEPNLLEQQFSTISQPGTVYGSDITYIPTEEGWLYLAGVKDFATREIIGHAMGDRMDKELVHRALEKALRYRRPEPDCIHHSDRGSQYCALSYQQALKKARMRPSMSRKGNCTDNAPTESFWGALKQELVHHRRFATRAEAKAAIQEYIEVFYNRMRRHSALGNLAPAVFAETYYAERRSA
jgi:transposase InsO family protein